MVRPREYGSRTLATILVSAVVMLPACTLSPEQAAVRAVLEEPRTMRVRPTTIQVLQTQSWGEEVNVLVKFQAIEESGQFSQCLFLYEAHEAAAAGWVVSSGGGGCGPVGGSGEPIDIGAGQHSGTGRPAISGLEPPICNCALTLICRFPHNLHRHVELCVPWVQSSELVSNSSVTAINNYIGKDEWESLQRALSTPPSYGKCMNSSLLLEFHPL